MFSVSEPVREPALQGVGSRDRVVRDGGTVTVEAALGICSIVAVLALALTGLSLVIAQLRCTDAAIEAARLVSRGEQHRAPDAVARIAPAGATLAVSVRDDQVGTEVSSPVLGGSLPGQWLTGRAYAVLEPGVSTSAREAGS
jgi:hypothetical protein